MKFDKLPVISMWCETCEAKTDHIAILNNDEFIARWLCINEKEHEKPTIISEVEPDSNFFR